MTDISEIWLVKMFLKKNSRINYLKNTMIIFIIFKKNFLGLYLRATRKILGKLKLNRIRKFKITLDF
jgi:hypothetical protein